MVIRRLSRLWRRPGSGLRFCGLSARPRTCSLGGRPQQKPNPKESPRPDGGAHTAGSRRRPQTLSPDSESRDGSTLRAVHLVPQWIRTCWSRAEGKRAKGEALRVSTRGRTRFYGA